MVKVYLKELDEEQGEAWLVDTLRRLEDEIQGIMLRNGLRVRELAMVYTKLQEARQWAVDMGERSGTHVILAKRDWQIEPGDEAAQIKRRLAELEAT